MAWAERHQQLHRHDSVVHAKAPLGGPGQVLEYLSRYTHRADTGNERIKANTPPAEPKNKGCDYALENLHTPQRCWAQP